MEKIRERHRIKFEMRKLGYLPMVGMMILIFCFSADTGQESQALSDQLIRQISGILHFWIPMITEEGIREHWDLISFLIRKLAHMTEYGILAILTGIGMQVDLWPKRQTPKWRWIMLVCVLYACSDEFHQLFVSERSGSPKDVCIDSIGAGIGACLIVAICGLIRKKGQKNDVIEDKTKKD